MRFEVLDASAPAALAAWVRDWEAWPAREVMAHPEYARLFARPGDRVVCVRGEDSGGRILFPLVLRPLSAEPWALPGEARWDAATPYGYGGPYAWGPAPRDADAYWREYEAWCHRERIVTTFARLSLFPEQLAPLPSVETTPLTNIVVPLTGGPEAVLAGYESKVRKWVRTAEAAGLTVEEDLDGSRVDEFLSIYAHTMNRNGADDRYYFPRAFFQAIIERLPGRFVFFHTLRDGKSVSCDLVLCSTDYVYYFLGGTLEEAFDLGPNYLLKHRIAAWACAKGKKGYVLGGGHEPGDGLYRYKRAYARNGAVAFKVSRLMHDDASARELAADRAAFESRGGKAWAPQPGFFPAYRA